MVRDHPWLGIGPDNFLYQYRGPYIRPAAWQEPNLSHPHNIVLDFWTRIGLLGMISGVIMQFGFWRLTLRALRRATEPMDRALLIGLAGAMANLLAHGLVDNSIFLVDLGFAFFLLLGVAARMDYKR
jgi:O-antigen ligase